MKRFFILPLPVPKIERPPLCCGEMFQKTVSLKNLIPALGALVVVGALLQRDFPTAGLIVTLIAVGVLLVVRFRRTVRGVRGFKRLPRLGKVRLITYTGLLYILLHALLAGEVSYFLLLLILAIEYLLDDGQRSS